MPPGPASSKALVARAEPNWTEVIPVRTSATATRRSPFARSLRSRLLSWSRVQSGSATARAPARGGLTFSYRGRGTRPTHGRNLEPGEPLSKRICAIAAGLIAMLSLPSLASAEDYAATALNIIPSGQLQPTQPPAPLPNDTQATMYDGLTPLFDQVSDGDLTTYFKSEALNSLGTDGPGTVETIPDEPGITITRDQYGVPHVEADSYDEGIFAAGWIAASDREPAPQPGAIQRSRRRDRRAGPERDRPRHLAAELRPEPEDRGRRRPADAGAQEPRQGGQEGPRRHRHLPRGHQPLVRPQQPRDRRLHAQRHLLAERAQGSVPRRGRR